MHENLKNTISLEQQTRNTNQRPDNWQLLTTDFNNYNTFYTISGRFRGVCKGNHFYPEDCDLHLQNYAGFMTMGLTGVDAIDCVFDYELGAPVYLLKIRVRAAYANEQLMNQKIQIKTPFSISKYSAQYDHLLTNYIDCTFNLRVEVITEPLDGKLFDYRNLVGSSIVDPIQYQRDGDRLFKKKYDVYDKEKGQFIVLNGKYSEEEIHVDDIFRFVEDDGVLLDNRCNPKYCILMP